jgi:hypothetical protein
MSELPFYRTWRVTLHDLHSKEPRIKEGVNLPVAHSWAINNSTAATYRIELECIPAPDLNPPSGLWSCTACDAIGDEYQMSAHRDLYGERHETRRAEQL